MSSNASEPVEISTVARTVPPNIWVKSIALVKEFQPVNLGQGFPDFEEVVPERLKTALAETQAPGASKFNNQYARAQGQVDLVNELSLMYSPLFGRKIDPMKEIIVTVGAYEALHCAISAVVNPGDEVVLIEPYFDSYGETLRQIGATAKCVPLRKKANAKNANDFVYDKEELEKAFSEKTKCIVVNTPHNPTGKVFSREEIQFIADLCVKYNCLYLSDEVYEYLVYEGYEHIRAASLPGMWERTITVGSAGKAFNATGFKTGWAFGPEYLMKACMAIHQGVVFTIPTPTQMAIAECFKHERQLLGTDKSYWKWLVKTLTEKRDRMYKLTSEAGLKPFLPCGGYFMMCDISDFGKDETKNYTSELHDVNVMEWLIKERGIASIQSSAFFSPQKRKEFSNYLRFCFIKSDETFEKATEKFKKIKQ